MSAVAAAVLVISLAVLTLLAITFMRQYGERELDHTLVREQQRFAQSVAAFAAEALATDPEPTVAEAVDAAVRRYLRLNPPSEAYAAFVDLAAGGRRLSTTATTPLLTPLQEATELPEAPAGVIRTVDTPAGPARATAVPVELGGEPVATMRMYAPLQPVYDQVRDTATFMAIAAAAALLIGGALLVGLLRRSLRPLRELARSARATDLDDLTARVEVPASNNEVATLAAEFNTMLGRLREAYLQQQWLIASMSHELRTPVTIARGHLELLAQTLPDAAEAADTAAILRDELVRLGDMVEDLLAMARAETDDFLRPRPIDLVAWFEELELKLTGHPASAQLQIEPPPSMVVTADAERLTQAVVNLVANAYRHNPPSTSIRVTVEASDTWVQIAVTDDGHGIPDAVRSRLFEPFVRSGEAEGSTGLGLSVVKAIVDAHGGEVLIDTSSSGTTMTISLPRDGAPGV
ncbi:MAG: HAMP domain-containing sensor histidine kinase [Nitriliruptoraceae bacterium]